MLTKMRRSLGVLGALVAFVALVMGCGAEDGDSPQQPGFDYPLDGVLRVNHIQAKASHNSYHVQESPDITAIAFSHAALDVQLAEQGVRGFELDTRWDVATEQIVVYHLPIIDDVSNCALFFDCLTALKTWSDKNPAHHPLFVQVEPKDGIPVADAEQYLAAFEAEILAVWPRERILAPDDVKGDAVTLRDAIVTNGWPTLGEARGKILLFIDEGGDFREAYTRGQQNVDGRLMFADSEPGQGYESVHVLNDPGSAEVAAAVAEGFIVRTRADSDNEEPLANDTSRREAALASGAQIVSTDYPAKVDGIEYVVELPGGVPSRCNPLSAPAECIAEAIENPEFIR
jgi:hypothetical protein